LPRIVSGEFLTNEFTTKVELPPARGYKKEKKNPQAGLF